MTLQLGVYPPSVGTTLKQAGSISQSDKSQKTSPHREVYLFLKLSEILERLTIYTWGSNALETTRRSASLKIFVLETFFQYFFSKLARGEKNFW